MPDWPHEYTIKAWRPELGEAFETFCRLILNEGFVEPWPPAPDKPIYHNHYLVIGGHKYWAMGPLGDGDPIEGKSVINREVVGGSLSRPASDEDDGLNRQTRRHNARRTRET